MGELTPTGQTSTREPCAGMFCGEAPAGGPLAGPQGTKLTRGPYQGYTISDNVFADGPYKDEQLAGCLGQGQQRLVPVTTDADVVYTGDDLKTYREMFGWTGETGTSKLFLDKAKRLGSICIEVTDPKQNEAMLTQLKEVRTDENARKIDPLVATIEEAQQKFPWKEIIAGGAIAAVFFIGFQFVGEWIKSKFQGPGGGGGAGGGSGPGKQDPVAPQKSLIVDAKGQPYELPRVAQEIDPVLSQLYGAIDASQGSPIPTGDSAEALPVQAGIHGVQTLLPVMLGMPFVFEMPALRFTLALRVPVLAIP